MRLDSSFCCVFLNLRLAFLKAYPLHISLTSTQSDISDLPQGIGTSLYYASRRTVPLYRKFLYLGVAFLDGLRRFLLRHGWSLLSAHKHRKRTVDFLGCPCKIENLFTLQEGFVRILFHQKYGLFGRGAYQSEFPSKSVL